jgi:nucleoside-diphosphate-sugar epimerase
LPTKNGPSKVLVTGGKGFIGSHVVNDLLAQDKEVILFSQFSRYSRLSGNRFELASSPRLKILDTTFNETNSLEEDLREVDAIVHLSAVTEIPFSLENPAITFEVNHGGTLKLLEVARRLRRLRHLVLVSSEQVYSMPPSYLPIDEKHPVDPSTPYALSKLQQEQLARLHYRCYGVPSTILRSGLLFGERQKDKGINHLIRRAIANQPITIEGGQQTRDIYHVGNLVHAINLALAQRAECDVFNISGKFEISVSELVARIVEFTGSRSEISHAAYRNNEGPGTRISLDISKAERELKYSPPISFEAGLERTVNWLLNNSGRY